MRKQYLQQLKGKNNLQISMSLLSNKNYKKYTKVAYNSRKKTYNINNFWLDILVDLTESQYQFVGSKLNLTNC